MAVVTLSEPHRPVRATQWADGMTQRFHAVAQLRRHSSYRLVFGLVVLGTALAVVLVAVFGVDAAAPTANDPATPAPRRWVEIVRPSPLLDLDLPAFGKEPSLYDARRLANGNRRRDTLAIGRFDGVTPYFRLSLDRIGSAPAPSRTFFVEMALRAADAALAVTRTDQPASLATRFGDFEVADVVLARGVTRGACLGFRFQAEKPSFRIVGFGCGSAGKPLGRTFLACTLDRLDLAPSGADRDLSQFFARARIKRNRNCGGARMPARHVRRSVPRKVKWLRKSTGHAKTASR